MQRVFNRFAGLSIILYALFCGALNAFVVYQFGGLYGRLVLGLLIAVPALAAFYCYSKLSHDRYNSTAILEVQRLQTLGVFLLGVAFLGLMFVTEPSVPGDLAYAIRYLLLGAFGGMIGAVNVFFVILYYTNNLTLLVRRFPYWIMRGMK